MVIIKFDFVLLLTIFHVSHCERRIVEGEEVTSDKSYVVYLVKSRKSDRRYDSWLCGGALVTKEFIITSAACVEDVKFMYAIAGYRKYIPDKSLADDDCTRQMKKKVVYTCVPVSYEFDFDEVEKWAYIDIALAKVESPYEFNNPEYQIVCSYTPTIIPINYDPKRQVANLDALVLGWGHTETWRTYYDTQNYNQEYLRFGATTLYDKNECKAAYKDYPNFVSTIDKYMICSLKPGHINDHGIPYSMNQDHKEFRTGCITQKQKLLGLKGALCKDEIVANTAQVKVQAEDARKHMNLQEKSNNATNKHNGTNIGYETNILNRTNSVNETDYIYKPGFGKIRGYFNKSFTRRNGICQNDHGGPLITWVGKREVLIGVASVFRITKDNKCIGPYLYTSTMCNGAFIGCIIGDRRANVLRGQNESVSARKALLCDSAPSVKGFDTIENYVSWKDHPDGPADNERNFGKEKQKKRVHSATIVQEDSDSNSLKDEEEKKDRFSLKMGPPPKRRPRIRKRPPKQKPSEINRSPLRNGRPLERNPTLLNMSPKMESPAINRRPIEMKPPSVYAPPPEIKPLSVYALPPVMKPPPVYARPPGMKPPPVHALPPEMKPSPVYAPPPEMKPPPVYALPTEMKPPPVYARPPEMKPPPVHALPPEMKPSPVYAPPPEMKPPPVYAPSPEMKPPPVYAPSPEEELLPVYAPPPELKRPPVFPPSPEVELLSVYAVPPEMKSTTKNMAPPTIAPLPNMEAPEFDEMLDFKSDEKTFEKKTNVNTKTANSHYRTPSEILLRPQMPLNG